MEPIILLLEKNPLLLLFAVAAIGYPLGRIRIGGVSLGIAALLFVGIGFGAIDPRLKLPEPFYLLGLALFIYTIGLSSAPGFFGALNRRGMKTNALSLATIALSGFAIMVVAKAVGLTGPLGSGLFSGGFTNSPALAAAVEVLKTAGVNPDILSQPVVAYSIAYPFGVLGPIAAILLVKRLFRIDLAREAAELPAAMTGRQRLEVRSVKVTRPEAADLMKNLGEHLPGIRLVFGRICRDGHLVLPTGDTRLQVGDEVTIVASDEDLDRAIDLLGEPLGRELSLDHSEFDFRRVFVSNPAIVGCPLRDLALSSQHGVIVTRIRRGDIDLLPSGDTVLELGDRVRVTSRRDNMAAVTKLFGDSYRTLSEVDLLNFSLGLAIGLALGSIPIPLPGGLSFKLGFAGGPLIVALIAGKLQRTGPIVWTLPYSANLTIRQIGLMLFAAGIGTRAGEGFAKTVAAGQALPLLAFAVILTFTFSFLLLVIGLKALKMPLSILSGVLAGTQTQPVLLAFANEQTKNELPTLGYATVYPFAMVLKIVLVQLLLLIFR